MAVAAGRVHSCLDVIDECYKSLTLEWQTEIRERRSLEAKRRSLVVTAVAVICHERAAFGESRLQGGPAIDQLLAVHKSNERLLTVKPVESFLNIVSDDYLVTGADKRLGNSLEKGSIRSDCYD